MSTNLDEGDELAPGMAVRISGDDVCDILDVVEDMPRVNALCTLAMALVQYADCSRKRDAAGEWVSMSTGELKELLAHLTSDMLDRAQSNDLWRPPSRRGR
jgi:predicted Fe-S protein YdhL (DUF1289 family)